MSTEKWLKSIHLQQYIQALVDAGYDSTTQCASLTDAILFDIGVTLLGHRKRILAYLPKVTMECFYFIKLFLKLLFQSVLGSSMYLNLFIICFKYFIYILLKKDGIVAEKSYF